MDPNTTLNAFLNACTENDNETALEMLDNLRAWIGKGGFLPGDLREPIRTELMRVKAKLAQADADLAYDFGRGRLRVALVKCARHAESTTTPDADLVLGVIAETARAALKGE